jgi:hypothetical protein
MEPEAATGFVDAERRECAELTGHSAQVLAFGARR